jgi:HEAT repeat protein
MPTAAASNSTWRQIPFVLLATVISAIFTTSLAHGQTISPDKQPSPVVLALIERLGDEDVAVRQATVAALFAMGEMAKPAIPAIARRLRDPDSYVRIDAAHLLERLKPDSIPSLIELLQDANPRVRELAARTLEKIGPSAKSAIPSLIERLGDEDVAVRQATVAALHSMGEMAKPAIPAIARRLRDPDGYVRVDAALTLADLGPASVPVLTSLLYDPAPRIRELSAHTLQQIGKNIVSDSPATAR